MRHRRRRACQGPSSSTGCWGTHKAVKWLVLRSSLFALLVVTTAMKLLCASVRSCRTGGPLGGQYIYHPPHSTRPCSTKSSAPVSSPLVQTPYPERCITLTATAASSTRQFSLLEKMRSPAQAARRRLRKDQTIQVPLSGSRNSEHSGITLCGYADLSPLQLRHCQRRTV